MSLVATKSEKKLSARSRQKKHELTSSNFGMKHLLFIFLIISTLFTCRKDSKINQQEASLGFTLDIGNFVKSYIDGNEIVVLSRSDEDEYWISVYDKTEGTLKSTILVGNEGVRQNYKNRNVKFFSKDVLITANFGQGADYSHKAFKFQDIYNQNSFGVLYDTTIFPQDIFSRYLFADNTSYPNDGKNIYTIATQSYPAAVKQNFLQFQFDASKRNLNLVNSKQFEYNSIYYANTFFAFRDRLVIIIGDILLFNKNLELICDVPLPDRSGALPINFFYANSNFYYIFMSVDGYSVFRSSDLIDWEKVNTVSTFRLSGQNMFDGCSDKILKANDKLIETLSANNFSKTKTTKFDEKICKIICNKEWVFVFFKNKILKKHISEFY